MKSLCPYWVICENRDCNHRIPHLKGTACDRTCSSGGIYEDGVSCILVEE